MSRKLIILMSTLLAGSLGLASAEDRSLAAMEAVRLALAENRDLRVAEMEIARAESRLRWSGRLDNPTFDLSASDDGAGLDENEGSVEVGFAQRFPLTSRLRDEKNLRGRQVVLADAEIAERRRGLAYEVDLAFLEWLATREKARLQGELVALNAEVVSSLSEQAEAGETSPLEVTQAKLAGNLLKQQSLLLETAEKQAALGLKQLAGLDPDEAVRPSGSLDLPGTPPPGHTPAAEILKRRPDYVLVLARIDEADASLALENARRWEDVTVKIFAERERATDAPGGLERNTILGVGLSIPLPLRKRNQEGIERAAIDREAAVKELEAARFRIVGEHAEAVEMRGAAWKLAKETTGEVLGLAKKNLEDFRTAQAQGQASLLQVQRAQEQVLQLRTAAVDAMADYHRAEAKMRYVTGNYPGLNTKRSGK